MDACCTVCKNDATLFRDFASKTLGIPDQNVKTLVNENESRLNTKRILKRWLPQVISEGETDLYLYFLVWILAANEGKFILTP